MDLQLKEHLKVGKCKYCQKGDFTKCKPKGETPFFIERKGKRKYFCNLGCILLSFNSNVVNKTTYKGFVESGLIQ